MISDNNIAPVYIIVSETIVMHPFYDIQLQKVILLIIIII